MLIFVTKKTNSEELAKNLRGKGHDRKFTLISRKDCTFWYLMDISAHRDCYW